MSVLSHRFLVRWVRTCTKLNLDFEHSLRLYFRETKKFANRATVDGIADDDELPENIEPSCCGRLSPLYLSAANDHESCAIILLRHGWDVDERSCCVGNTALHVACAWNHSRMVKLLLDNWANPNATNRLRQTPLVIAIENEASACVDVLLEKHVDVINYGDTFSSFVVVNASTVAARSNDVRTLRKMTENYAIYDLFSNGNDPLISASAYCNHEALEFLLDYVIEQNRSHLIDVVNDRNEKTPLMSIGWRCSDADKRLACLNSLLEHGADPNVLSRGDSCPALYFALSYEFDDRYLDVLMKRTDLRETLSAMIWTGNSRAMKSLFRKKNDVVKGRGTYFVIEAYSTLLTNVEMVKFLIETAVDVVRDESLKNNWFIYFLPGHSNFSLDLVARNTKLLLQAGFAEHTDVFQKVYFPSKNHNDQNLAKVVVDLIWKYGSQKICNFLLPNVADIKPFGRLPSLQHSCRTTVRSTVLLTGKYRTMFEVDADAFRLPTMLGEYILFSDDDW